MSGAERLHAHVRQGTASSAKYTSCQLFKVPFNSVMQQLFGKRTARFLLKLTSPEHLKTTFSGMFMHKC